MGWKKCLQLFLLRAMDGFQMGNHTLELTPAKGLWCSEHSLAQEVFLGCAMPPVLGMALDLTLGCASPQVRCPESVHTKSRAAPAAQRRGCGCVLLRAEKQNWLSQQSELSDHPFHLTAILWVECDKLFFWQLSFNSWHCCLVVPAQLCVMTTC